MSAPLPWQKPISARVGWPWASNAAAGSGRARGIFRGRAAVVTGLRLYRLQPFRALGFVLDQREAQSLALLEPRLGGAARQLPHAADIADPLAHRDRAARVEQVEE